MPKLVPMTSLGIILCSQTRFVCYQRQDLVIEQTRLVRYIRFAHGITLDDIGLVVHDDQFFFLAAGAGAKQIDDRHIADRIGRDVGEIVVPDFQATISKAGFGWRAEHGPDFTLGRLAFDDFLGDA